MAVSKSTNLRDATLIRVGTNEDVPSGDVEGYARFCARWHGYFEHPDGDGGVEQQVRARGKVARVFSVPGRYRAAEPRVFVLTGYGSPTEIGDTSASAEADFFFVEFDVVS